MARKKIAKEHSVKFLNLNIVTFFTWLEFSEIDVIFDKLKENMSLFNNFFLLSGCP